MRSENDVKLRPRRLRHFVVNGRYTREQCRGRELELADHGWSSVHAQRESKILMDLNII
jgi:hypothetical protein